MVAKLDENFSKPSQRRSQRRLSWKSEAIKRGQLRISVPVSMMDEPNGALPEGHAYPLPPLTADAVMKRPSGLDEPLPERAGTATSPPKDNTYPTLRRHASASNARSQASKSSQRHTLADLPTPQLPRKNSEHNPLSNGSNTSRTFSPANAAQMKRRRSVLRRVVRKLLGKKEDDSDYPMPSARPSTQHNEAEAITMKRPAKERPATANPASMSVAEPDLSPVKEIEIKKSRPSKPAGIELPFPMNINAPVQPSPISVNTHAQPIPAPRQRRNSLPSIIMSDGEVSALASLWSGSAGKNMTALDEYRYSRLVADSEIGIAITTPRVSTRPPSMNTPSLRTRSTGALFETARLQAADDSSAPTVTRRRRSSEIRYWRESMLTRPSVYSQYQFGDEEHEAVPPLNIAKAGPEQQKDSAAVDSTDCAPTRSEPGHEVAEGKDDAVSSPGRNTKPRTFHRPSLSIEDRMAILENDTHSLHNYVQRLAGRTHRQTIILENSPSPKSGNGSASVQRGIEEEEERDEKRSASRQKTGVLSPTDPATFLTSPSTVAATTPHHSAVPANVPPFPSPNPATSQANTSQPDESVLHDSSPLPTKKKDEKSRGSGGSKRGPKSPNSPLTAITMQLTAVVAALHHERKSRKALEHKVTELQTELAELHALTKRLARGNSQHMYPTPSPDEAANPRRRQRDKLDLVDNSGHSNEEDSDGFPPGWDWRNSERRQTVMSHFSQDDEEDSGDERKKAAAAAGNDDGNDRTAASSDVSPGDAAHANIIASDLDTALLAATAASAITGRSNSDGHLHRRSFRRTSAARLFVDTHAANARFTRNRSLEGWQQSSSVVHHKPPHHRPHAHAAHAAAAAAAASGAPQSQDANSQRRSRRASLPPQHRYSIYSTLAEAVSVEEGELEMVAAVEKGQFAREPRVAPLVPPVVPHSPRPRHVVGAVMIGGENFF